MELTPDPTQAGMPGISWRLILGRGFMKVHLTGSLLCAGLMVLATSGVGYAAADKAKKNTKAGASISIPQSNVKEPPASISTSHSNVRTPPVKKDAGGSAK